MVEASGLGKVYGLGTAGVEAVRRVSLSVRRGEFVAIMGPSGSGKSTLLHMLGALDEPSSGEIAIGGESISGLSDRALTLIRRRKIGFVFQFFNLLPTLTADENIALPLIIDGKKPSEYRATVDRLLSLVGLEDRRHHRPDELSGGEQQRVAIARALAADPAIVLADEPTGNLDTKTGRGVLELIHACHEELGQTIVMVTHDPKAAAYADRVVFLRDGEVAGELEVPAKGDGGPVIAKLQELGI